MAVQVYSTAVCTAIPSGFPHFPSSWIVNVDHSYLGSQVLKVGSKKRLGKNVCCLENCWSVKQ